MISVLFTSTDKDLLRIWLSEHFIELFGTRMESKFLFLKKYKSMQVHFR